MPPRARKVAVPAQAKAPAQEQIKPDPFLAFLADLQVVINKHLTEGTVPWKTDDRDEDGMSPGDLAAAEYEAKGEEAEAAEPEPVEEKPKPAPAKRASRAKAGAAANKPPLKQPEPEPDEASEPTRAEYAAELGKMSVEELRDLAISMDYDADAVAEAGEADLIESILEEKYPGAEPEAEAETEDAPAPDDEDEAALTREELAELSLGALRKLAASVDIPKDQYIELDHDGMVDFLMNLQDEAIAEQGGHNADAGGDEPEADEDDSWTREDMEKLSRAELLVLAGEYGVEDIPKSAKPGEIIDMIFATASA